jgi:GT2 family glycosyltransferase
MSNLKVALITVSYYSEGEIEKLIESIGYRPETKKSSIQMFIVSNSGDCSKLSNQNTTVLQSGFNAGFAKACNIGAAAAESYDVLIFCNPDVRISAEAIFSMSEQVINNQQIGIVSPSFQANIDEQVTFKEVKERIPGACYVIRNSLFKDTGGWDESFFLWGEDRDLLLRIKKLGYLVGLNFAIQAKHLSGHSWKGVSLEKEQFFTKVWICSQTYLSIKLGSVKSGRIYCIKEIGKSLIRLILRKKAVGRSYDNTTAIYFSILLLFKRNLESYVTHSKGGYSWQNK